MRGALLLLFSALTVQGVWGQSSLFGFVSSTDGTGTGGIRIGSVSLSTDYFGATKPVGAPVPLPNRSDPAAAIQGGVDLSWMKSSPTFDFSVFYSPSYIEMPQYSSLSALNHIANLNFTRRFGTKFSWQSTLGLRVSSFAASLTSPTFLASLGAANPTYEDLANAIALGTTSNGQLASLLNGASDSNAQIDASIYGNRNLSLSFGTGFTYRPTHRLSIDLQTGVARAQTLGDNTGSPFRALIPNSTMLSAGLNVSYSYSPRTQLGVGVTTTRTLASAIPADSITNWSVSFGRKMSERWFLQASLGSGFISPGAQTVNLPPRNHDWNASGTIGFKTRSQTFMFTNARQISVAVLAILGYTRTVSTGSWSWSRPGSAWGFQTSYSYFQYQGNIVIKPAWTNISSVARRLSPKLSLNAQYVYEITGSKSLILNNVPYQLASSSFQTTLIWHPGLVLFR